MTRLPVPGSDDGDWGTLLNDFLEVSHGPDGSLLPAALTTAGAYIKPTTGIPATDLDSATQADLGVANTAVQSINSKNGSSITLAASDVGALATSTRLSQLSDTSGAANATNGQVLSYNSGTSQWVASTLSSSTASDATTSTKGIVELAGDLAGTAVAPSVVAIKGINLPSSAPSANQVLTATSNTTTSWSTPTAAPVSTVAGRVGAVTLAEADIANLTSDLSTRAQTINGGLEAVTIVASSGSAYSINAVSSNLFFITLTAACTISLAGATNGSSCSLTVALIQDATGSRAVTWPGTVNWAGGVAPTLTTTAGKTDFISLLSINGGASWYGFTSGLDY
jgi:hypothetical protein